jgi:pyruvate formate lyase activating enzyme
MKKALFYTKQDDKKVQCILCPHNCIIEDASFGICKVRTNRNNELYASYYGKICALNIDNIEKKPLYHFYPGSKTLSLAMPGCNLRCDFCQNYEISQNHKDKIYEDLMPEDIIKIAKAKNIDIISYTYTEPTVFFEFMLETQMLAKASGIKNVVVSNAYINSQPLDDLLKFTDAFNIDLKSFRQKNYEKIGAKLEYVLNNIEKIYKNKIWLEITSLLIPDFNNSYDEIEDISSFIANLGNDIPWHISSYYKTYKATYRDTNLDDLKAAYAIALASKLKYVYLGNINNIDTSSTSCYACNEMLILRNGSVFNSYTKSNLEQLKNKCFYCGAKISGVF